MLTIASDVQRRMSLSLVLSPNQRSDGEIPPMVGPSGVHLAGTVCPGYEGRPPGMRWRRSNGAHGFWADPRSHPFGPGTGHRGHPGKRDSLGGGPPLGELVQPTDVLIPSTAEHGGLRGLLLGDFGRGCFVQGRGDGSAGACLGPGHRAIEASGGRRQVKDHPSATIP